jgi:thiosulfate/3-mercaptopyruvate sulfurtransferase
MTDPADAAAPLTDPTALARRLADADPPTVLDVRWRLPGSAPGAPPFRDEYRQAHIPGAVFVDLDADLCGPPGEGGRHPLPEPGALQQALRTAGVRDGHPVVVYDAGDNQAAARAWWTLRWAGHPDTRVLDGGWAAWRAAGLPTESGEGAAEAGDVTVRPGGAPVLDAAGAAALAGTGVLVDARIPGRYRGEVEPVDPVAGRIPGAVNVPAAALSEPDGRLRAAEALRAVFADAGIGGSTPVGAYWGADERRT